MPPPADLHAYLSDQREIAHLLGAEILWVESPEVADVSLIDGLDVRPGDELRTRYRMRDGSESWGGYVVADRGPPS